MILISSVIINFSLADIALAQQDPSSVSGLMETAAKAGKYETDDSSEVLTPYYLVGNIIRVFIMLLGIFFMGLILYGGFMWMNAKGNDEQIKKAQGIIKDAVIGLIIAIGAYAITYFVLANLGPKFVPESGF